MKRVLGALILSLPICAAAGPPGAAVSSSLDRFRLDPTHIVVGEVAHDVQSNLDGSKPTRASIFVAIPFPDNPDWKSFRLELQKVETMTPAAWKAFVADSLAKANARPKG